MQTAFAPLRAFAARPSLARDAVLVVLGSVLLAISAKVQVPFWPVPMTMQTFVVLMLGAHAGLRVAAPTVALYLIEGAVGLPVFSTGAGLAFMAGPTGGYLAGFLLSALLVSFAFARGFNRNIATTSLIILLGDIVILGLGFSWLSTLIGVEKAFAVGVVPFLPAEALKIALTIASVQLAKRHVRTLGDKQARTSFKAAS
ncbi:MAG: biotin transporter BioY, partial [Alphaproteobacteria bacterium]